MVFQNYLHEALNLTFILGGYNRRLLSFGSVVERRRKVCQLGVWRPRCGSNGNAQVTDGLLLQNVAGEEEGRGEEEDYSRRMVSVLSCRWNVRGN